MELGKGEPSNRFINVVSVSKPCSKVGIEKTFSQGRSLFALTQGNTTNRRLLSQVFHPVAVDRSQCCVKATTTGDLSSSGGSVPIGRIGGVCSATIS